RARGGGDLPARARLGGAMIAEIGAFCAALALALALAQAGLGFFAFGKVSRANAAAACAQGCAFLTALAFACLVWVFVSSDFSVAVVAANSHTDKPLLYKIAGAWGNHEGSMLLWCLISASFAAVLAGLRGAQTLGLWSKAVAAQGLVTGG